MGTMRSTKRSPLVYAIMVPQTLPELYLCKAASWYVLFKNWLGADQPLTSCPSCGSRKLCKMFCVRSRLDMALNLSKQRR